MTLLDLLLGLFLIYLVFAMAVSAINEAIAAFASSRAKWLRRALDGLLGGSGAEQLLRDSPFIPQFDGQSFNVSYLNAADLLRALMSKPQEPGGSGTTTAQTMDEVLEAIKQYKDKPLWSVLDNLCKRADGSLESFEREFGEWYKSLETQISSWYRQKTHWVLAGISLFIAVALNVDTVQIIRHLSVDSETKSALVQLALKQIEKSEPASTELTALSAATDKYNKLNQAVTDTAQGVSNSDLTQAEREVDEALAQLRDVVGLHVQNLDGTGLPLGWSSIDWPQLRSEGAVWFFLAKLLGWIVSAAAFTLGAPFWFDMLKRIASVRSVGRSPSEQSSAEAAKLPAAA